MTIETPDPVDVAEENLETFREKREDYGDSWRLGGDTIAMWADALGADPVDLSDPDTAVSIGLYTRRLDKMIRAFNGEFCSDGLNFESINDSHADESNYALMHATLTTEENGDRMGAEEEEDDIVIAQGQYVKLGDEKIGIDDVTITIGEPILTGDIDEMYPEHEEVTYNNISADTDDASESESKSCWTQFWVKEPDDLPAGHYEHVFIEAPEDEAEDFALGLFTDVSRHLIFEYDSLEVATRPHRASHDRNDMAVEEFLEQPSVRVIDSDEVERMKEIHNRE